MKPFGVKGISSMKKDELQQLCLLYDVEVPASLSTNTAAKATSNLRGRLQLTREFQESMSNEDRRETSEEDEPQVRTRRKVIRFATPETDIAGEEEIENILSDADSSWSCSELPPRISAASKGKQKQTSNDSEVPSRVDFPSRERGTALPRPRPTFLSGNASTIRQSPLPESDNDDDSDWDPKLSDDESLENHDSSFGSQNPTESNPSMDEDSIESNNRHEESIEIDTTNHESEASVSTIQRILNTQITQLNNAESSSNQDNPADLRQHVQSLGEAVRELATLFVQNTTSTRGNGASVTQKKKKSSAEFLSRIRSHVRKLMGLRENEEIPASATRAQISAWRISTTKHEMLSSVHIDRLQQITNQGSSDPRFPYNGGPGGEFSNPQELLIMWTMMNRVGVSSFRPVWEEAISSVTNSFLWRLAAAIFVQLVKCGQYDNITQEDAKFDVVLAALKKHARQSLQRNVRERNEWPVNKIRAVKKNSVRQQRVRSLRTRRKEIALRAGLPLLCNLIDHCCSDDESDFEGEPSGSQKKVFRIKKLVWRSTALQTLLLSLEAHRAKEKEKSPKGTPGVRPTERIRDSRLLSQAEAPPALPIDCYDADWLKDLEQNHPEQYEMLQVDPTPILHSLEVRAYNVLKIPKL
ncbi:hypothetical protein DFH28DRAFT_1076340 [Melampsora americana]|nr:hypothetical protein DFH28DRAFT_1076340 [Melampsora americana]